MTQDILAGAMDASLDDYITKAFAVLISTVRTDAGNADMHRKTFDDSLSIATREYNLALKRLKA